MFSNPRLVSLLLSCAVITLGGCQTLGPTSIELGRDRYNNAIQTTSKVQTLSNIVRTYHHELPLFMDVAGVTAQQAASISVTGTKNKFKGTSGIFSILAQSGSYSETPTISYQPISGPQLVAQLVTPVSVDAISLMHDSSWPIGPLIDLSVNYLSPNPNEFYPALDTIIELDHRSALAITAGKSKLAEPAAAAAAAAAASSGGTKATASGNDALILYIKPFRRGSEPTDISRNQRILQLWVRLVRIYAESQPPFTPGVSCASIGLATMEDSNLAQWDQNVGAQIGKATTAETKIKLLNDAKACLPSFIELRILSGSGSTMYNAASISIPPSMRTYSALGILKNATDRPPGPKIEFVTPATYAKIRSESWNSDIESIDFYTLLPEDLDSFECSDEQKAQGGCELPEQPATRSKFNTEIEAWLQGSKSALGGVHPSGADVYEVPGKDSLDKYVINLNGRLGTLRRYILVVAASEQPTTPTYASYYDGKYWYYIDKDDVVSQKNFELLSLFLTIMAVPPATQPLTPVISVGG